MTDISFKLTDKHIKHVCKIGKKEKTCRFLALGELFSCEKFGSLGCTINDRVKENKMVARGDNCDGLLGVIIENKADLIGKKVKYKESFPTIVIDGTVKDLVFEKEKKEFTLHIDAGENSFPFMINTDYLEISNTEKIIRFSVSGVGLIAGFAEISKSKD